LSNQYLSQFFSEAGLRFKKSHSQSDRRFKKGLIQWFNDISNILHQVTNLELRVGMVFDKREKTMFTKSLKLIINFLFAIHTLKFATMVLIMSLTSAIFTLSLEPVFARKN
jgi:hypothetical protein